MVSVLVHAPSLPKTVLGVVDGGCDLGVENPLFLQGFTAHTYPR
jgi:hypothetical protein